MSTARIGAGLVILLTAGTAMSTAPADPSAISLTGRHHPHCTALPFRTLHRNAAIRLHLGAKTGGEYHQWRITLLHVPAGRYRVRWCGQSASPGHVAPGTYRWHVRARHRSGGAWAAPTRDRRVYVLR